MSMPMSMPMPVTNRRTMPALLCALALLVGACGHGARAAARPEQVITLPAAAAAPGDELGYVVRLPPGYDPHGHRTYPTIVFLHGFGERGNGSKAGLALMMTAGLPLLVAQHQLPAQAQPFLILMPQTSGQTWSPQLLHRWLGEVLARYRVDRSRTYLTGLSMGGGGTVGYLAAYGDAGEFAAMVAIAQDWEPEPTPLATPSCAKMQGTPLWAFAGDLDDVVPNSYSINLVNYLNAQCHERERARVTLYLSDFHNSWDRTYDLRGTDPDFVDKADDPYSPDIYTWLLQHRKGR